MVSFKVNNPLPQEVGKEISKCADIIDHFVKPGKQNHIDSVIPQDIIANAKGLAIFSIVKAGFVFSGRAGSGLVIAR